MTRLIPTASGTVGPFFPPHFFRPGDNDLTVIAPGAPAAAGRRIHVFGHIYEAGRVPRWNSIIEIWQADAGGRFAHPNDPRAAEADPHFMGWGRRASEDDGYFDFITVMPGGYDDPVSGARRAPHINLSVTGSGLMRRLTTTLFFPGEPGNDADPVLGAIGDPALRARLVLGTAASPRVSHGLAAYSIDIVLQGDGETPFFVD
ncbi:MAG: protocatechuate 3,4-dioxygenase subunit alpha [Burkholderiales bacterium]|nr:protocatechuate 3,4-dioxygenase subunit alpha [Burkholderiales bacterium]